MGAIFGPLAFRAGEQLGAVVFVEPVAAMVALSVGWAVMLPAVVRISERLDGHEPKPLPAAIG